MQLKSYNFAMLSHPGRVRKGNEDTCAASPEHGVFVLCDGMGGAAAGEIASALAAKTFLQALNPAANNRANGSPNTPDAHLQAAVFAANQAVHHEAQSKPHMRGMGTTLVGLVLQDNESKSSLHLAHVGDSRCYLFRAGTLTQLTVDHSFVEEQVRMGEISAAQAATHPMRNIITRAIGIKPEVQPDIHQLDPQPSDLYLLASDGLTRDLSDDALTQTLAFAALFEPDLPNLCQTLIEEANNAGGGDNITVLLLQIP